MIDKPTKTYVIKSWELVLRNGRVCVYNVREDLGDTWEEGDEWLVFTIGREHQINKVKVEDISVIKYEEIEQQEMPAYVPTEKRGMLGKRKNRITTGFARVASEGDPSPDLTQ